MVRTHIYSIITAFSHDSAGVILSVLPLSRDACSKIWGEELKGLVEDRGKRGQLLYLSVTNFCSESKQKPIFKYLNLHSANPHSKQGAMPELFMVL